MLLAGKVGIVSGAGPGLGAAVARAFVREGAAVALAARRVEPLEALAAELAGAGGRVMAVPTDITDRAACERLVARCTGELGGIDVLVNNAFRMDPYQPFATVDLATWRRVHEVNVFGTLTLTQAALPVLRRAMRPSIVFVNSMSARKIRPNEGGYASSKGALLTVAQSLARELGPDGIRVNSVVPGWIMGPNVRRYLAAQAEARGITEAEVEREITREIPLGVIPPQDDVANAVVFFASDLSAAVTGQALDVNGGEYFG